MGKNTNYEEAVDEVLGFLIHTYLAKITQPRSDTEKEAYDKKVAKLQQVANNKLLRLMEKRELEARIDELKKVDMLTKPLLPNSGSVETNVKAWVKDRLPQLKAQQEEV